MHGLVYEIFEEWVLEQQGPKAWHAIKQLAGCDVKDHSFVTRTFYSYDTWVELISAAAEVMDSTYDDILEAYGHYNIRYHFSHGYEALLKCQGSTLRQWLSNLNAMHDHIQKSFPGANFCPPVFWCEDSDRFPGCIKLHYYSQRGNRLVSWVVGIVKELASYHFDVEINMTRLALQDVDGSKFTTWRISAVDERQNWKLSPRSIGRTVKNDDPVSFDHLEMPAKCPFSGRKLKAGASPNRNKCPVDHDQKETTANSSSSRRCPVDHNHQETKTQECPVGHDQEAISKDSMSSCKSTTTHTQSSTRSIVESANLTDLADGKDSPQFGNEAVGVTYTKMKEIFPFHVLVNQEFSILQVGLNLPRLLDTCEENMVGRHIAKLFRITRPVMGTSWDWKSMNKLSDQNFFLEPTIRRKSNQKRVSIADGKIRLKASIVQVSSGYVMFSLSPEAQNVEDLNRMGLTLSDLPLQTSQRDAVFLGEYVSQEADKAHKLDKLSRKLDEEKNLSNTLLYSIIPRKVADDLRKGKTVEPTYHENVTLFFSDIVGFTNICDKVQPWDVIDMMNQLYSIMDHLASYFNLFKVETVGDSYMCCSGLPEPDEYHAENVANFALAVLECSKCVKSPVDGTPVQLRIGIHTGSCTSGVVGTMTPHYCLFGDMVNTTSRHESTGIPGRIHCSSVLYSRLTHFAKDEAQLYNFKARGLIDMKGKGEHYTYFLESAKPANGAASPEALAALANRARAMIASKTWKMRKYFRKGGLVRDAVSVNSGFSGGGFSASGFSESQYTSTTGSSDETSSNDNQNSDGSSKEDSNQGSEYDGSVHSDDSALQGDIEPDDIDYPFDDNLEEDITTSGFETIISFSEEQLMHFGRDWDTLDWEDDLSHVDSALKVIDVLTSTLRACVHKEGPRMEKIESELCEFVMRIAEAHTDSNMYHSFGRATQVFLRAVFLWEQRRDLEEEEDKYAFGRDPWDRFVLLFSALIHCMKHDGVTDTQLQAENHILFQLYRNKGSYQQRGAFSTAFEILEEEFGSLYEEIVFGCPNFRRSVRSITLCTDIETKEKLCSMLEKYKSMNDIPCLDERAARERNEARIGLILALASVGHYSQSYDIFVEQNKLHFQESLAAFACGRGEDPRESWYYEQSMYFKDAIIPLCTEARKILPKAIALEEQTEKNIGLWGENGKEWLAASMLPKAKVGGESAVDQGGVRMEKLIVTNVEILENLLKDIVAQHQKKTTPDNLDVAMPRRNSTPFEEIKLVIEMKRGGSNPQIANQAESLPTKVRAELRDFVITIAAGYQKNDFHNFLHASHVVHLSNLLVTGIHASENSKDASGIAYDPLAKFAIVLSALVHDVGHSGVPNGRLAEEKPELAQKYRNQSIAEQNSIDTAWDIFMSDSFRNLRQCLFESVEERDRLRQLLVNCVMATDIFDKDLRALRKSRWERVFSDEVSLSSDEEESHCKATIVIEHIMQASDVAHTMQEWEIYRQWNENLFHEMYEAFLDGRALTDPSDAWYKGELWFFDNWVIPLAVNLKECGVLDIVSNQLIKQARSNRLKWEIEGEQISLDMLNKAQLRGMKRNLSANSLNTVASASTSGTEAILTSQIVSEVESLSKVVKRYERKMEAACGNLIAVAYKGQPGAQELKGQTWSNIHNHFRQQEWYRFYSDDDFSRDGSEMSSRDISAWGSRRVQILVDDLTTELARAERLVKMK